MTAYDIRISDWSSDVCSTDLIRMVPTASFVIGLKFIETIFVELRSPGGKHPRQSPIHRNLTFIAVCKLSMHPHGKVIIDLSFNVNAAPDRLKVTPHYDAPVIEVPNGLIILASLLLAPKTYIH